MMNRREVILFLLSHCLLQYYCMGVDKITSNQVLQNPETIVSNNGEFELGFFSPPNSTLTYLGIWYSKAPKTQIVWVANRNNPQNGSSGGVIRISEDDGNLHVLSGQNETLWSSNVTQANPGSGTLVAQLQDSGNLILMRVLNRNETELWQSFEHPTDTALPDLKLVTLPERLTSWNGSSDPSTGRFSFGIDSITIPQLVIWEGQKRHWRSGPWTGSNFKGIQISNELIGTGWAVQNIGQVTVSVIYNSSSSILSNYELSYNGTLSQKWWDDTSKEWKVAWTAPTTECDLYGKCGDFGSCDSLNSPICQCLKGFEPKNKAEWDKGNWADGCIRSKPLQCGTGKGKPDGFFTVKSVKAPDQDSWLFPVNQLDPDECRSQCLQSCNCSAYLHDPVSGCMSWSQHFIDTEKLSSGGVDLFLRLAHSELENNSVMMEIVAASVGAAVVLLLLVIFLWRRKAIKQAKKIQKKRLEADVFGTDENEFQLEEVPLLEFGKLEVATNNFQDSNKLGRGGFGSVYKGLLEDGREIAVKRLSRASGQGQEEFINEVTMISKLQHRNLVRLLGCCIEREEKMLIYEYLPNKSLDWILFDPLKRELLPWSKRYDIIHGICEGLLYLHRDSRLRIIHRDLKASNILLDKELNPKISDFGMARIFGEKQDQDDTRRIVGTYGYMSPEYAMEGRFSEKSDVFSFGVLLLEIVSGKKNSLFWFGENSFSLLGYAYKLWNEDKAISFVDPMIAESCFLGEIQKCIEVGLLCVQESAKDRPSIATVISILHSKTINLPHPKQPGFAHCQQPTHPGSSSEQSQQGSVNNASLTILSAR